MSQANLEELTRFQLDELARWFLHHMGSTQRAQLMAEKPVTYDKLYPGHHNAVLDRVSDVICPNPAPLADWEKELLAQPPEPPF